MQGRLAFVTAALILGGSPVSRGDERPPGVTTCRAITDDAGRLACYDRLAMDSAATPAPITPEALFGMEPAAAATLLQRQQGDEPLQYIEQPVATVTTDHEGKLALGLANGQQWVQVDSGRLRLKPGDTVRIRRAALGSHLLHAPAGGRSIRVRRVDGPAGESREHVRTD